MSLTSASAPNRHSDINSLSVASALKNGAKKDDELLDHFEVRGRNWDGARGGVLWNTLKTMMSRQEVERVSRFDPHPTITGAHHPDAGKLRLAQNAPKA